MLKKLSVVDYFQTFSWWRIMYGSPHGAMFRPWIQWSKVVDSFTCFLTWRSFAGLDPSLSADRDWEHFHQEFRHKCFL